MLEVLCSTLTLTQIGEQVGKVDATTKVIVINRQALFEVLHAFLEVFHFFIAHSNVVEGICFRRALVGIFRLNLDCFLERVYSWLPFVHFVENLALQKESLSIVWLNFYSLPQDIFALMYVFT